MSTPIYGCARCPGEVVYVPRRAIEWGWNEPKWVCPVCHRAYRSDVEITWNGRWYIRPYGEYKRPLTKVRVG